MAQYRDGYRNVLWGKAEEKLASLAVGDTLLVVLPDEAIESLIKVISIAEREPMRVSFGPPGSLPGRLFTVRLLPGRARERFSEYALTRLHYNALALSRKAA